MLFRGITLAIPLVLLPLSSLNAAELEQKYQLIIRSLSSDALIYFTLADTSFCLQWNHSVTHIHVSDCFIIRDAQLFLDYSIQPDFAAGLGHFEGRGTLTSNDDGTYLIYDINEPIQDNRLRLRVGSNAVAHTLQNDQNSLNLSQLFARQAVTVSLATQPLPASVSGSIIPYKNEFDNIPVEIQDD